MQKPTPSANRITEVVLTSNAHRIRSDIEAIEIADALAVEFERQAAERDALRMLPFEQVEQFSRSGLWGITIPKAYGGPALSVATLAEVIARISKADPSIGQIPQNHYFILEVVRSTGSEEQKGFFFQQVLAGARFGNALSELGTKTVGDYNTRIIRTPAGFRLAGRKYYSTGALFAHWIPVVAKNEEDYLTMAFVERGTPGLTLVDDWNSFGQRTTGSGTTILEDISLPDFLVLPYQKSFDEPTPLGPLAQIIHAAVDLGIAQAAIRDTVEFVRTRSRPWIDSNVEKASEDPLTISQLGREFIELHAAEALVKRAGIAVDRAIDVSTEDTVAEASVAVAEAKAATTRVSLLASNKLFELAGTQATLEKYHLDRHWRNARTHTLHDPVRWKYFAIGNYYLGGVRPPRHGAI
jgi:SfnB family sulfur acquisition oxidoreductase